MSADTKDIGHLFYGNSIGSNVDLDSLRKELQTGIDRCGPGTTFRSESILTLFTAIFTTMKPSGISELNKEVGSFLFIYDRVNFDYFSKIEWIDETSGMTQQRLNIFQMNVGQAEYARKYGKKMEARICENLIAGGVERVAVEDAFQRIIVINFFLPPTNRGNHKE